MLSKYKIIIGVFFGIFLTFYLLACSASDSAIAGTQNAVGDDSQRLHAPNRANVERDHHSQDPAENHESLASNTGNVSIDCRNPDSYKFIVVENPARKTNEEQLTPKDLNILIGEEVTARIELPVPDWEVKNFSLNSVEKKTAGFEVRLIGAEGNTIMKLNFLSGAKEIDSIFTK